MATPKFILRQNLPNTHTTENPVIGEYSFSGDIFTIGSDAANNLVLSGALPEQLVVMRDDDERLTLMNSADGTSLNGSKLRREAIEPLTGGDRIEIGDFVVSLVFDEGDSIVEDFKENAPLDSQSIRHTNERLFAPETISLVIEPAAEATAAPRNFAEILDTLRTEEDSFYFIRQGSAGAATANVPLENIATPIGETAGGDIAFTIEEISTVFAIARKDWSGILLESQRHGAVFVNDEPVEATRRLRNDDRVRFAGRAKTVLVLHEPSSLVALESLLSARVDSNTARFGGLAANHAGSLPASSQAAEIAAAAAAGRKTSPLEKKYFNHFSFVEIVSMIIGTLIGAVLFFLAFEIIFS